MAMPPANRGRPGFLRAAFDPTPAAPCAPTPEVRAPDMPEMPQTPMAIPPDSRPPSSSGERSRKMSQGFVKISEVESTKRMNDSLEKDNAQLELELAELLRLNIGLRDNIGQLEQALGLAPTEPLDGEETDSHLGSEPAQAEGGDAVVDVR